MNYKIKLACTSWIFIFLMPFIINAQEEQSPTLTGNVQISIKQGTISCHFILKDMPKIPGKYVVRLNSGMNIRYFKDLATNRLLDFEIDRNDTLSSGASLESLAYYFPLDVDQNKLLASQIEFRYGGMYPVTDSIKGYTVQDWRGNVAFNGYSVRIDGTQSSWYPVLFDMETKKSYENVKFDINITCADCNTLYVNGQKPVKAKSANFKSNLPQQLTIYCGNYKFVDLNGTVLLNPDLNGKQQIKFLGIVNDYKTYLEKRLSIPYKGNITFIQTAPTASPKEHAFMFVTYPTILNVGVGQFGLASIFDLKRGGNSRSFIAHELGHYYFGTVLQTNSGFGPIINESFAEFLSFKIKKDLISDSLYRADVKAKATSLMSFKPNPLATIKSEIDMKGREFYIRIYVPVLLCAIEEEIGEKAMWNWLRTILLEKTEVTDYAFLERTFYKSLSNDEQANRIVNKFFKSGNSVTNISESILKKP